MVDRCKDLATVWTRHACGPQEWLCPAVRGEPTAPEKENTGFRMRGPGILPNFPGDLERCGVLEV